MLNVEDWAEVRRLHFADGLAIKEIARRLGLARNTVRAAVRSDAPPQFRRAPRPSAVDGVEGEIRALLKDTPTMPATTIAERIGWDRGITILKERVAELRPAYLPADPCGRTEYRPGELAQFDLWFPAVDIPVGGGHAARLPVFTGVSGYSRVLSGVMIPSRECHDILLGHRAWLQDVGGVPRKGVYDGEAALSHRHGGRVVLSDGFQRFRGALGMGVIICKPRDPEAKGLVERAHDYLERRFLPGRRFESPADFNGQLRRWCWEVANRRTHATLGQRPLDRLAEDRAAMLALPACMPDPALRLSVRLPRDHWVRAASNDYSCDPRAVGRRVDVRVDLEEVVATAGREVVGRHRRCWARNQTVTDPDHDAIRKVMAAFDIGPEPPGADVEVEVRDLTSYDRALQVPLW